MRTDCGIRYIAPSVRNVAVIVENGYAATGGFEQPDYGGEDNL